MDELIPFDNGEFRLEIEYSEGLPIILVPPVARSLGFRDGPDMLRSVPSEEKGYKIAHTSGGKQRIGYVTLAGLLRTICQRQTARIRDPRKRAAVERFQSWVFHVALPPVLTDAPGLAVEGGHDVTNRARRLQHKRLRRERIAALSDDGTCKHEVFDRDQGICWHCLSSTSYEESHIDHLVGYADPECPGNVRWNVVLSCAPCNMGKPVIARPEDRASALLLRGWYGQSDADLGKERIRARYEEAA